MLLAPSAKVPFWVKVPTVLLAPIERVLVGLICAVPVLPVKPCVAFSVPPLLAAKTPLLVTVPPPLRFSACPETLALTVPLFTRLSPFWPIFPAPSIRLSWLVRVSPPPFASMIGLPPPLASVIVTVPPPVSARLLSISRKPLVPLPPSNWIVPLLVIVAPARWVTALPPLAVYVLPDEIVTPFKLAVSPGLVSMTPPPDVFNVPPVIVAPLSISTRLPLPAAVRLPPVLVMLLTVVSVAPLVASNRLVLVTVPPPLRLSA